MITFKKVNKWFGNHHVLKDVDFHVDAGEVVVICGPSGSGKSTLIRCINRLELVQEGDIVVDTMSLNDPRTNITRLRAEIGFVFQQFNLYPHKTALENVIMPALIARVPRSDATRRGMDALGRVGLAERLDHRAGELSGGEQQRVAIARALLMRPKLILADEPTGNLDVHTGEEVSDLLVRLNEEEGTAMVIVTHNQRLAEKMSRRMEIVDGKIC